MMPEVDYLGDAEKKKDNANPGDRPSEKRAQIDRRKKGEDENKEILPPDPRPGGDDQENTGIKTIKKIKKKSQNNIRPHSSSH
jgi:hypothetical protein